MTATITSAAGAEVLAVNTTERIISVIVVPYEQPALVEYRGEIWEEVFSYGAFDSLDDTNSQRIRVNREHVRSDTVGKAVAFNTRDPRGLIADIRIAQTTRGDDTLGLAAEDMLSASGGFAIPSSGQIINRTRRTRRVTKAFLDHIALVMQPAYEGAQIVAMRSATPRLDQIRADPIFTWAQHRTDPIMQWARRRVGRR